MATRIATPKKGISFLKGELTIELFGLTAGGAGGFGGEGLLAKGVGGTKEGAGSAGLARAGFFGELDGTLIQGGLISELELFV